VSSQHREGGVPRAIGKLSASSSGAPKEENWIGANEDKAEKLRVKSLRRAAGAQGLELRHSAYGYALINPAHKPIEDRNDMSLREIESCLKRAPKQ
jgi:hypothetical protein